MSAITVDNDLVHYEVLGRGRPVILLHDWLGSWRYWIPAMQQLSMKYRTYALDLWGFGDSGRDPKHYSFDAQVQLLDQFMDKLGITKAALIGHGLGAAIVARYAIQKPDRVPRLMTVSPPLFRMAPASTPLTANPGPAPTLPAATKPPTNSAPPSISAITLTEAETIPKLPAETRDRLDKEQVAPLEASKPKPPHLAAIPPDDLPATEIVSRPAAPPLPEPLPDVPAMPKVSAVVTGETQRANPLKEHLGALNWTEILKKHVDPGPDLDKLKAEVDKADMMALAESVNSFADVDTLRDIQRLTMPCVAVFGADDSFLPPPGAEMLATFKDGASAFHPVPMPDIKHFPMLENMAAFSRLLLDFLEAPDVTKVGIKETWERRVR